VVGDAGAQVLFRRLPLGFTLAYLPKGPVGADWTALWPAVDVLCRQRRAAFLKVEPDLWEEDAPAPPPGFRASEHAIQPRRTLVVDLSGDEDAILMRMAQKTRYNIRLARRKGVVVRATGDVAAFYDLMQVTGERDRFGVHSLEYYRRAYELFSPREECVILLAEYEHQPLAALMAFARGKRAWYFYGASSNEHRNRMPTYLLQWEAMRWAKARGCVEYDLWGVPDADYETLEAEFTHRKGGLWGVYRFKRGFGGRLCRAMVWDRVYLPPLYLFYRWWVRRRG